jgi:hypothetical protein
VPINDYQTSKTGGSATSLIPPIEELSAHELVGHGLGRELFGELGHQLFALQMDNIYVRQHPFPYPARWRNGADHDQKEKFPYGQANAIPSEIFTGVLGLHYSGL